MPTRRTFLKSTAAAFLASGAFTNLVSAAAEPEKQGQFIWGNMMNLGSNMWGDAPTAT